MCSHYEAVKNPQTLKTRFGVAPPSDMGRGDMWPGYLGPFVRSHPQARVGDEAVPAREALLGAFGLVPPWAKDATMSRHTYNARSETVAQKPSFSAAWREARHCIIAAEAFYEPDWRSGKAIATRIARADGQPMGIAGLWERWKSPQGAVLHSFTMLTVNADAHPLMRHFHKPQDEKRMVVVLPEDRYGDWLEATAAQSASFLTLYPAQDLVTQAPEPLEPPEAAPGLF